MSVGSMTTCTCREVAQSTPRTNRRVLGLTLDTMWSIKDYVLSGAVTTLAEEFPVVVWVSQELVEGVRRLLDGAGAHSVVVRPFLACQAGRTFHAVCKLQRSIRFERYDVDTEQVIKRRTAGTVVRFRSPALKGASTVTRLLAKSPVVTPLERTLARLRRRLAPADVYTREFDETKIGMVMMTDPIKRDGDPIYFEAKRRGLPRATLVLSWDNLTSKGVIHGRFSKVMVWNEAMRDEIGLMYPWYAAEQVSVVGFPRFDVYRRPFPARYERSAFLRAFGLDPERPVLLYASSAAKRFHAQNQVLEHICAAIASGEIGHGAQLLIRCHPQDDIDGVRAFRGRPGVAVWPPQDRVGAATLFDQLPDPDELLVLAASVAHSAAVVGVGSTVMLDAARCDVPIVCVAYDGDMSLAPDDSIASVYGYSHQKPFHELGATDLCYSRADLIASIGRALEQPGRQAANRARLVDRFLGGRDSSIDRIRHVLEELDGNGSTVS